MIYIKKSILFGITNLTLGGAERVLVDMCNKICEQFDITIFTIYDNGELKKELNPNIKYKCLYNKRYDEMNKLVRMWIPIKILFFSKFIYNKYIKDNYDTEVSFLEGPVTRLISTKNSKTRKIAWIHSDIKKIFGLGFKSKLKNQIDKITYKKFDDIVFVSEDSKNNFESLYQNIPSAKLHVFYNYIDADKVILKANEKSDIIFDKDVINFVSVCRLVKQKAVDRFIRVHSKLIKEGFNHKVFVIGDGPEMNDLKNLIIKENVEHTFFLLGKKENPYPIVRKADYFCLLSESEGYGMVLEEAKILKKKIVITDTAARECLQNYEESTIIPNNENDLYKSLKNILKQDKNIKQCNYDTNGIICNNLDKIIEFFLFF